MLMYLWTKMVIFHSYEQKMIRKYKHVNILLHMNLDYILVSRWKWWFQHDIWCSSMIFGMIQHDYLDLQVETTKNQSPSCGMSGSYQHVSHSSGCLIWHTKNTGFSVFFLFFLSMSSQINRSILDSSRLDHRYPAGGLGAPKTKLGPKWWFLKTGDCQNHGFQY